MINAPVVSEDLIVSDLKLKEVFRQDGTGSTNIELQISWNTSSVADYQYAEIYFKHNSPTWVELDDATWQDIDDTWGEVVCPTKPDGFSYDRYSVYNAIVGTQYTIKVVAVNRYGTKTLFEIAPEINYTVVGKTTLPSSPSHFTVDFSDGVLWKWDMCNDSDYSLAELRIDQNTGLELGRLDISFTDTSTAVPPARAGTAYLYFKDLFGNYSDFASIQYNKPVVTMPTNLVITNIFQGFIVSVDTIPDTCIGMTVVVNGESFYSPTNTFTYNAVMGDFAVKVAYKDIFGDCIFTNPVTVTIMAQLISELLGDEAVTLSHMDQVMQNAVAQAQASVDTTVFTNTINGLNSDLSSVIEGLNQSPINSPYASIAQLQTTQNGLVSTVATIAGNANNADAILAQLNKDPFSADAPNFVSISQLKQNADSISATVATKASIASLNVASDSISTIVANLNQSPQSTGYNAISQLKQTADSLALTVASKANASSLTLTDSNISAIVGKLNSAPNAVGQYSSISSLKLTVDGFATTIANNQTNLQSQINQTSDSILSVVTELNKPNPNYSAFGLLQDSINLRVSKNDVINQINISTEGIYIGGSRVHITGKTIFDNGIIISRMIGDQQVVGTSIANGAITTDKICANSITANHINANVITGDKLVIDTITAREIASHTITANEISAGTITSAEIKAGSIFGDRIVANSISGDRITAGTIDATRINSTVMNLTNNGQTLSAGSVTLDATGMKVLETSGSYTKFDDDGITWYNPSGVAYSAIRRSVQGSVSSGKYVRLNWEKTPFVILSPRYAQTMVSGYTNSNIQVVCEPYDISPAGFRVRMETRVLDASGYIVSGASFGTSGLIVSSALATRDFSVTIKAHCGYSDYDYTSGGWIKIQFYYSVKNANSWVDAGLVFLNGNDVDVTRAYTVFSSLTPNAYDVKMVVVGSSNVTSNPILQSYSFQGGGVLTTAGDVNFLAIESDGNSYYTIEN